MVRVQNPDGSAFHEPPYTEEEEADLYRRANAGPMTFTRPGPTPEAVATPRKRQPRRRAER